jgi:hypothetical protein
VLASTLGWGLSFALDSTVIADPEGGAIRTHWALRPESSEYMTGGDFRHAAADDGARKSGHLSGLAYIAGHTDKHTTSRYIHPQIDDAREVLNKRFPSNGTPSGTRSGGGEGSQ